MSQAAILDHIRSAHDQLFNAPCDCIVRAPGRANLVGEHTDYNDGLAMPFAIDKHIFLGASRQRSAEISIQSLDLASFATIGLDQPGTLGKTWTSYFQSAVTALFAQGIELSGVAITIKSSLPFGEGMSSSSALTCGFLSILNAILDLGLTNEEIIQLASEAENGTGVEGGQMDQMTIMKSRKGCIGYIDFFKGSFELIPCHLSPCQVFVIASGIKHKLVDSAYNTRRKESREALMSLARLNPDIVNFRDVTIDHLQTFGDQLTAVHCKRLKHIVTENNRVLRARTYILKDQLDHCGPLLNASHHSLRDNYECSIPEIDRIVDKVLSYPSCLGARIMGGGFGGSVISLWKNEGLDAMDHHFDRRHIHRVMTDDGLTIL